MRKTVVLFAVLLATAALSGCGTYCNLVGGADNFDAPRDGSPTRPFGGVTRDLYWGPFTIAYATTDLPHAYIALAGIATLADVPLSLVGDTVTLPYTIPCWLIHGIGQPAASEQHGQATAVRQLATGEQQPIDWHSTVFDVPSSGPERVHGGIGPGF